MEMKNNTVDTREQEGKESLKVDFKMVTFTLAGKDYGIDIMRVKEIHKAEKFTFVPNSAHYVKGVYNMRGDIISVIDLRVFFNLPVEEKENSYENMIILGLEDHTIGILVDTIEKVLGVDSAKKQAPHPLFGDINVKYIDSIIENDKKLYIVLDAERIFSKQSGDDKERKTSLEISTSPQKEESFVTNKVLENKNPVKQPSLQDNKALHIKFISETLEAYSGFYVTDLNRTWVEKRYDSWLQERGAGKVQLEGKEDALAFLSGFTSSYTGQLWGDNYIDTVKDTIGKISGNYFVWNPGCAKGYETYSIASILKKDNPNALLKVQGNDSDLINISGAPSLNIESAQVPSFYKDLLTESTTGYQFNSMIKDSVIFEYSDLLNQGVLPKIDFIVCRDTLSYLKLDDQAKIFSFIEESLKPGGILLLGENEVPYPHSNWSQFVSGNLVFYKKVIK